jgi:outer membrane receptor protein involved in Fe transport
MRAAAAAGLLAVCLPAGAAGLEPEIVVTAARTPEAALDLSSNTARIDAARVALIGPTHANELGSQLAGTWIARGSEQESLPAIRSPVLTGPGSCGAFLVLEDGIPVRPAGFCNVNEIFEIPFEQADAVEIVRGPAKPIYGANGLHGTLNVLLPAPGGDPSWKASGEWGSEGYLRTGFGWRGALGGTDAVAGLTLDHDADFRQSAGYDQAKGFFRANPHTDAGDLQLGFAMNVLRQDSAGYIVGQDAYRDPTLRVQNLNPDAYRDADSERLYGRWLPGADSALAGFDLRAFLRHSGMDFLQNFLPGEPREQNGQWSTGLIATHQGEFFGRARLTYGVDTEIARGFLKETQAKDAGVANRPVGKHYDYDAWSFLVGPYGQVEVPIGESWNAAVGVRLEYMHYAYDNRMLDGNTRDDGTPCTPRPCLFDRPADRSDGFFNVSPNLALRYRITPQLSSYVSISQGFRPPQATELYRLQTPQQSADLNSEKLDSAEIGLHWESSWSRVELAGFLMRKRNFIFQNSNRLNVSDGKTRHRGVELQAEFRTEAGVYGGIAGTYARHTYAFTQQTPGELITTGNIVDTAPRTLGSIRFGIDRPVGLLEVEGIHIGRHFIDAADTAEYVGHNLLNLRAQWRIAHAWSLTARLNNVLDKHYAERADLAFGQYRYFPGRDRELHVQIGFASH